MIQNDPTLTEREKKFLLYELLKKSDPYKIGDNSAKKQKCSNCQNFHQATRYCEFCIRKYLENNFKNWTSGNNEIDKLIQECQKKTVSPDAVIEWISYDQFENVKYLKDGGYATIFTAIFKCGSYNKWNSKKQKLQRLKEHKVILKRLNYSNSNNLKWFQEVTFNFTIDSVGATLVRCWGLTKDPITNDYMLVLDHYDSDLRNFLERYHRSLSLIQKYNIVFDISCSLDKLHQKDVVHRDLHSGNILYNEDVFVWHISDLGMSGPVDKPLNNIYGNMPYMAPEFLENGTYTIKSDIYSLGILMWEIETGESPFWEQEHDLDLAFAITKGYRPKLHKEIPKEYSDLMKQCWDTDPNNRPDTLTIQKKIRSLTISLYNEMDKQRGYNEMDKQDYNEMDKQRGLESRIMNFFRSIKKRENKPRNATKSQIYF
ncbi:hypothetical protein Glove_82g63 [Diversispora epigaea]|uniref:Protein kinase domain-containing protein n=1 Tax=Diversispora epigaea TaxID=1348612 RepID=A0A397JBD1_9GLOM|nr:hypothetical protein Glove_82g63 [Diversispora epigaea]